MSPIRALRPQHEVADRDSDDIVEHRVVLAPWQLAGVGLAEVVDQPFLEPLDLQHLHLDDVAATGDVYALHIHDRELLRIQLGHQLGRQVLQIGDEVFAIELEQVVQQRYQQVLVVLVRKKASEREVVAGVGEDGHRRHAPW